MKTQPRIELELKAWVPSLSSLERKLKKLGAVFQEELKENDSYFTFANTKGYQKKRFRLRELKDRSIVTVKIERNNRFLNIDANQEVEFEIKDPDAFRIFAKEFGFRLLIKKRKMVKRYRLNQPKVYRDILIELVKVEKLGNFIELEMLLKNKKNIDIAAKKLRALLSYLGIPETKIEPTPYTKLLYDKFHSHH